MKAASLGEIPAHEGVKERRFKEKRFQVKTVGKRKRVFFRAAPLPDFYCFPPDFVNLSAASSWALPSEFHSAATFRLILSPFPTQPESRWRTGFERAWKSPWEICSCSPHRLAP